jgi:signal transduction histidine kinase
VLTPLVDSGRRIAVIEHDAEVLRDPRLLESVVALARVAVTNATLEREVTEQVAAVRASRRRLLLIGDDQRTQLESELRSRPQARLARVEDLLTAVPDSAELRERLATCGAAIGAFARGVHPRMLTERGLADALAELVDDAASPIVLDVPPDRFQPAVEAAAYFVCAESLTNVAKYVRATEVRLRIAATDDLVVIEITDDGVGGANPARGSGLVSLTDRGEALDGTLQVVSTRGLGTRVKAVLPRRVDRAEPG